jgi:sugar lactone lactonase YvrE
VQVFTPYAQQLAKIKIPKGSGTNLCFGGVDRFASDLYITTREALYKVKTPFGGK